MRLLEHHRLGHALELEAAGIGEREAIGAHSLDD
jgi:hypothetical protein